MKFVLNIKPKLKIQLLFGVLLVWSGVSILFNIKFYPVIIFPHFTNQNQGYHQTVIVPKVFSVQTGKEVNIVELIKPYDKRFILFTKVDLCDAKKSASTLKLLEKLNSDKTGRQDSFYVQVQHHVLAN